MTLETPLPEEAFNPQIYEDFVTSRVKWLGIPALDLHHASTGMVGEAIELAWAKDIKNVKEELGDFLFYNTAAYQVYKRESLQHGRLPGHEWPQSLHEAFFLLIKESGDLLDYTKKLWIYNKPLDGAVLSEHLFLIDDTFSWILRFLGIDYDDLRYTNYIKLMKRYPVGYTDAAAQARADKPAGE